MKCQKGIPDGSKFCNFCGCRQNKPHAPGRHCLHFRFKDPSGLSKDKYVYGKTRAEAEKKKRQFLLQVDQGLRMSEQGYSFAQWSAEWLKTYKLNKVKPGTYATYAADVHRMNAHLGNKPLSAILPIDIVRLMDTRRGLSASAIRKTYITINAIMTAALDNRLIMHNPCRGVAIPQGSSGTHRAITQDEIDLILSVARDGHRFSLPVLLMLFAGLRRGEAAGLNASDIKGNEIHINRSIYWTHNRPNIDTPKTNAGIRIVPVFPPLEPFLKFTGYAAKSFNSTPTQGPITLQSFERGYESFMRACEEKMNGFSKRKKPADYDWKRLDIRTHDLRHTFATMLYDAGVDLKTAQRWLGHADPSVTLKIYTHLTDTRHSAAVSTAGEYLRQVTGTVL